MSAPKSSTRELLGLELLGLELEASNFWAGAGVQSVDVGGGAGGSRAVPRLRAPTPEELRERRRHDETALLLALLDL